MTILSLSMHLGQKEPDLIAKMLSRKVYDLSKHYDCCRSRKTTLLSMTVVYALQKSLEIKILIRGATQMVEEYFFTNFEVVFASRNTFSSEYLNIAKYQNF